MFQDDRQGSFNPSPDCQRYEEEDLLLLFEEEEVDIFLLSAEDFLLLEGGDPFLLEEENLLPRLFLVQEEDGRGSFIP